MGIGILKGLLSNRLMSSSCGEESSVDSDVNLVPVPDPEELLMFPRGFLPQIFKNVAFPLTYILE